VENPSEQGQSDNFQIQIYDPVQKSVLMKTYGISSRIASLIYIRTGLSIIVEDIPKLPLGTTSNFI